MSIEKIIRKRRILIVERPSLAILLFMNSIRKYSPVFFFSLERTDFLHLRYKFNSGIPLRGKNLEERIKYLEKTKREVIKKVVETVKIVKPDIIIAPLSEEGVFILSNLNDDRVLLTQLAKKILNKKFQQNFKGLLNVPTLNGKLKYPLVVKPAIGRGSENVHVVKSKEEFERIKRKFEEKNREYVVQSFIPGNLYVTFNFFSNGDNILGTVFCMRKKDIRIVRDFYEKKIRSFFRKINFIGFSSIQCKISDEKLCALEIHPRISHVNPEVLLYFFKRRFRKGRVVVKNPREEIRLFRLKKFSKNKILRYASYLLYENFTKTVMHKQLLFSFWTLFHHTPSFLSMFLKESKKLFHKQIFISSY